MKRAFGALLALLVCPSAGATGLIPGPSEAGFDQALADKADLFDRQMHIFNAAPFGLSLDAWVPDANDRALVTAFLAQTAIIDFADFTMMMGPMRTVEDVISHRGEYGDLGMFGGVPAAGDAYRYMVLRDSGADVARVAAARQDLLDAIAAFHVYTAITGEPGTIARGIRKSSEVGPPTEPFPASCPNAWERSGAWREDESGIYPNWHFMDETSKDQLLGYIMAIGAFWDAIATDPDIPSSVKTTLQADASAMGQSLMQPVEVRTGTSIDLVIRDLRGCITRFHDLNPREVLLGSAQPLVLSETSNARIGFNAIAALGIIRTLYHISGDETLRAFYYDELVGQRDYPSVIYTTAAPLNRIFVNACVGMNCAVTNFSNVNMAFVAIYGVLRYETDPQLRTTYQNILETELWDGGRSHMGVAVQQAFFNLIYAGFKGGPVAQPAIDNASAQLADFHTPPYFHTSVENCDAGEITAGSCIGVDGTTVLTLDSVPARGGDVAAVDPLPISIRRPNNFEWRSDPRVVNGGGGGVRLNPGGDFRGAYWLGRMLQAGTDNVSPIARNPDGTGGPTPPGSDAGVRDSSIELDGGTAADATANDASMNLDATISDGGTPVDGGATIDAGGGTTDAEPMDASIVADAGRNIGDSPEDEGCSCSATRTKRTSLVRVVRRLLARLRHLNDERFSHRESPQRLQRLLSR